MSVESYVMNREQEHFRVFTMKDYQECILYDSTRTPYDVPDYIGLCIIEKIYTGPDGIPELEV